MVNILIIVPSLVEMGSVVLEEELLNFVNVFSLFRNYLPLEKGGPSFEQSFGFLYKFDVCMSGKTTVLIICIHK